MVLKVDLQNTLAEAKAHRFFVPREAFDDRIPKTELLCMVQEVAKEEAAMDINCLHGQAVKFDKLN